MNLIADISPDAQPIGRDARTLMLQGGAPNMPRMPEVRLGSVTAAGARLFVEWQPVRQIQEEQLLYHVQLDIIGGEDSGSDAEGEDAEQDIDAADTKTHIDIYSGHQLRCTSVLLPPSLYKVSVRAQNHCGSFHLIEPLRHSTVSFCILLIHYDHRNGTTFCRQHNRDSSH
eukprot:SAG31_NODE_3183_length_4581_cov_1.629183_3_plen_171_part_00